jgi:hypothetical protein
MTIEPAPIATDNQHVCFICLLNDAETPDAKWCTPCPCTLEAHEECLLRWVTEMEQNTRGKKNKLRCPACSAKITIKEPFDPAMYLQWRLYNIYSRTTPYMLLLILSGGSIAGSAWYGLSASQLFAGVDATAAWLNLHSLGGRSDVPLWRWAGFWKLNFKIWVLSLIGPTLCICRGLPILGYMITVPTSLLVSNEHQDDDHVLLIGI